jgi:hypothetical protein
MNNYNSVVRAIASVALCALVSAVTANCATAQRSGFEPTEGADGSTAASSSGGNSSGGVKTGSGSSSGGSITIREAGTTPTADGCVPVSCAPAAGGNYCGEIGDGCGGAQNCGACPNGGVCGGDGVASVCSPANCTKGTCTPPSGVVYCGDIGDGCGGVLSCGMTCPNAGVCGAQVPGVCPGTGVGVCTGIQCNIATCPNGGTTSVSGVVYDPAAVNPIYNALVYIPNAPLDPFPAGATCETCSASASGQPIATALTDTAGHFQLTGVPNGANIPLVIQVGKWRRQVTIATVNSCVDNPITDPNVTRLPRSQSEGDIPLIAVTTGNADALECLLRRIGIADTEFTTDMGTGRVHLYYGGDLTGPTGDGVGTSSFAAGGTFSNAGTLWSNVPKMENYDIMLLSCEGSQEANAKQPYLPNMEAYLNAGGRVFFDHDHMYWLNHGSPAIQGTADYIGVGPKLPMPITGFVNTTFPKGMAMSSWLTNVGASPAPTQLSIYQGQHSVAAVNAPTQAWITVPLDPADNLPSIQYMTFNTPVLATPDAQCGRAVFTDLHMNTSVPSLDGGPSTGGDNSDPTKPFPTECKTNGMSPQAMALEFMFFDLSACVQPDTATPVPPPPPASTPPPPTPIPPPPAM